MLRYVHLVIAIMAEVAATMMLPATNGVTPLLAWLGVLAGYSGAFYFLSLAIQTMPIAIAYSLWSGIGTSLVAVFSWLIWKQPVELPQIIGILLIIVGSAVLHLGPHGMHLPGSD